MTIPELDSKGLRKFGLTTGFIVLGLFSFFFPWILDFPLKGPWELNSWYLPPWPWSVALFLWFWAAIFPLALNPIYRAWMTLGYGLNWINTRIILFVLFYFMFFPMGKVMLILRKDPMSRKFDENAESYRTSNSYETDMERQF